MCRFLSLTFFEISTILAQKKEKLKDQYLMIENATAILSERIAYILGSNKQPRHVFDIFPGLFEEEKAQRFIQLQEKEQQLFKRSMLELMAKRKRGGN